MLIEKMCEDPGKSQVFAIQNRMDFEWRGFVYWVCIAKFPGASGTSEALP